MRSKFELLILILLFPAILVGCGQSPDSKSAKEASEISYKWTTQALLRMQVDSRTLKEINLAGVGGKAKAQHSDDPELSQYFASDVLPQECLPLSAILNGSPNLGDELLLTQQSDSSSFGYGNVFYQFVRTFPNQQIAKQKMSELLSIADKCGTYTRIRINGESDDWNLWDRIVESNSSSMIAKGKNGTFGVGQIGSATYFQWSIYDSSSISNSDVMISNARKLKKIVESLLTKEQGL